MTNSYYYIIIINIIIIILFFKPSGVNIPRDKNKVESKTKS